MWKEDLIASEVMSTHSLWCQTEWKHGLSLFIWNHSSCSTVPSAPSGCTCSKHCIWGRSNNGLVCLALFVFVRGFLGLFTQISVHSVLVCNQPFWCYSAACQASTLLIPDRCEQQNIFLSTFSISLSLYFPSPHLTPNLPSSFIICCPPSTYFVSTDYIMCQ